MHSDIPLSQNLFRSLIEFASDSITVLDANGVIHFQSPSAERLFGWRPEELTGHSLFDWVHPEDQTRVQTHLRATCSHLGASPAVEMRLRHRDGKWLWLEALVHPLNDVAESPCVVLTSRDITARKEAEAALLASEERFRLFMDNAPAVAWITDAGGRVVLLNRAFTRLMGLTAGEASGKSVRDLFSEEVARIYLENNRAVLESRRSLETVETGPRADGTEGHFLVVKFPLPDASGQTLVGGVGIDITDLIRVQQALRESEEQFRSLSRRLVEVQEEERRHLALELHDQIGQMLTGIKLILSATTHMPEEALRANVAQAEGLVQEVMGRVRELSLDLRPAMLDDLGLLPALLWYVGRYENQTGVRVTLTRSGVQDRLPSEVETAAYRIVQEALTNIARYAEVQEAQVQLESMSGQFALVIEDQGRGFDPEEALTGGKSSGLAGMRERALLLGGTFSVQAAPGEGVRVRAVLPVNRSKEE